MVLPPLGPLKIKREILARKVYAKEQEFLAPHRLPSSRFWCRFLPDRSAGRGHCSVMSPFPTELQVGAISEFPSTWLTLLAQPCWFLDTLLHPICGPIQPMYSGFSIQMVSNASWFGLFYYLSNKQQPFSEWPMSLAKWSWSWHYQECGLACIMASSGHFQVPNK